MSRAYPTSSERDALRVQCEFCDAPALKWCRSRQTGGLIPRLHKNRTVLGEIQRRKVLEELAASRGAVVVTH